MKTKIKENLSRYIQNEPTHSTKLTTKLSKLTSKIGLGVGLMMLGQVALGVGGKFTLPEGQTLMIIGQDIDSIDNYRRDVGITPGGVTGYTGINDLAGFTSIGDWGAGRNHLTYLADQYPNSAIALGVSFNNQTSAVANGQYNNNIDNMLNTLAGLNRPIFLRWGYEVDGPWNNHQPAGDFVRAWRYVYNRIQELGYSDRIAMVWQTATWCGDGQTDFMPWWPGREYVDWTAFSYFTPQDCNWSEVDNFMNFARQQNLPVMIAEFAPQTYDTEALTFNRNSVSQEQIWNDWYRRAFDYVARHRDLIRAVAYINADWDSQPRWASGNEGYWGDTRVQANQHIMNNWLNEIQGNGWTHASTNLFANMGFGSSNPNPPAATPNPTAQPTPPPANPPGGGNPVNPGSAQQEAESSSILGSARTYQDGAASGGQGVAYISDPGAGIQMSAPSGGANTVTIRYASEQSGQLSYFVNGQDSGDFQFNSTGSWVGSYQDVTINVNVPAGATFAIIHQNGDAAMNIDYVSFGGSSNGGSNPPASTPTPTAAPNPTNPTPAPTAAPNPGTPTGGDFGINDGGVVYFKDQGWSGSWNYICVNGDCANGQKANGNFERQVDSLVKGQTYQIQLKVQDDATGQYISPVESVVY